MNQFAFAKNPTNELANFYLSAASRRSSRRAQNFLHFAGLLARRQVAVATTIFPSVQSAVAAPLFLFLLSPVPCCQLLNYYIYLYRGVFFRFSQKLFTKYPTSLLTHSKSLIFADTLSILAEAPIQIYFKHSLI